MNAQRTRLILSDNAFIYLVVAVPIIALWIVLLANDSRLGVDFYPLYFGGEQIRAGISPYGDDATRALMQHWNAPFAKAGVAYPLPLLLMLVPLSLLPFGIAVSLWIGAGILGSLSVLRLKLQWYRLVALPFLFMPFHRSVVMGQATLIWFGLAVGLVIAIQAQRADIVGVLSALLILKPQNGLFFALAGLVWAVVAHRRALWWFVGASVSLWGMAFVLQPGWLQAWFDQVRIYQTIVHPPSLLPLGLLVVAACWKLPWWARIAAAQVVFFPLSDLYSALPLLLCWVAIGGPLSIIGASVSWLWSILGMPSTVVIFWLMVLLPLIVVAIWQGWIAHRIRHGVGKTFAQEQM